MFFTENSCLLSLSTRLMRVKQNCKVVGCEIFFFFLSLRKSVVLRRRAESGDSSQLIYHCKLQASHVRSHVMHY